MLNYNNVELDYLAALEYILEEGESNFIERTGNKTYTISGLTLKHDMADGFPLITTKEINFYNIGRELEFFLKGKSSKSWLQERGTKIWNDWANPKYLNSKYSFSQEDLEETLNKIYQDYLPKKQLIRSTRSRKLIKTIKESFTKENDKWILKEGANPNIDTIKKFAQYVEDDLGPIYGWQWRNFGAEYEDGNPDKDFTNQGVDQLQRMVNLLRKDPSSRQNLINAWNAIDIPRMALPPCHYSIQAYQSGGRLDVLFDMRSTDMVLGFPYDLASYGIFIHLLSKEVGIPPGKVVAKLGNAHIYENQIEAVRTQLKRWPFDFPQIETKNFTSIFDWEYTDSKILNYKYHPSIKAPISV